MTARGIARLASVAATALLVTAGQTGAASAAGKSELAVARAATAAYHDLDAVPGTYQQFLPCFETTAGGMGQHFVDGGAIGDPAEDPAHPEALVYAETPSGYRLVALEYIVPASLVDPADPPELFGEHFHLETVPGAGDLYVLHVWLWSHNPNGMYADWNPALDSCGNV